MRYLVGALLAFAIGCGGSGGDDDAPAITASKWFCDEYVATARERGCAMMQECEAPPAACEMAAHAWFACVKTDLMAQCICESSGSLNCEGSYKANGGTARCVDEFTTLHACLGD